MPPNTFRKLAGKHVLVIGGSSGIGYGVAEGALADGALVTIASSSQARVDKAVAKLQEQYGPDVVVQGLACDLSEAAHAEARIEALFRAAVAPGSRHGPVINHVVLTAAAGLAVHQLQDVTVDEVLADAQMRLFAPLFVAKVCERLLPKSNASSVTFTTGFGSSLPPPNWPVVCFMTGGLEAMTRSLAVDMAPIRVNIVRPGAVRTELWDKFPPELIERYEADFANSLPTGAMGKPEEVAEAYLWVMKDSFVTGTEANSNGGVLIKR